MERHKVPLYESYLYEGLTYDFEIVSILLKHTKIEML